MEAFSEVFDFKKCQSSVLAAKLRRFYCKAKPKSTSKRSEKLTDVQITIKFFEIYPFRNRSGPPRHKKVHGYCLGQGIQISEPYIGPYIGLNAQSNNQNWCIKLPTTNLSLILKTLNKLLLTSIPLLIIQLFFDNVCDITRLYILLLVG